MSVGTGGAGHQSWLSAVLSATYPGSVCGSWSLCDEHHGYACLHALLASYQHAAEANAGAMMSLWSYVQVRLHDEHRLGGVRGW